MWVAHCSCTSSTHYKASYGILYRLLSRLPPEPEFVGRFAMTFLSFHPTLGQICRAGHPSVHVPIIQLLNLKYRTSRTIRR